MNIFCYSFSSGSKRFLGGVKEQEKTYSLFLQDRYNAFSDMLGGDKNLNFKSQEEALSHLQKIVASIGESENVSCKFKGIGAIQDVEK